MVCGIALAPQGRVLTKIRRCSYPTVLSVARVESKPQHWPRLALPSCGGMPCGGADTFLSCMICIIYLKLPGWKPYNLHELAHISWVGSVLYRCWTAHHIGRLVSTRSRSWSVWCVILQRKIRSHLPDRKYKLCSCTFRGHLSVPYLQSGWYLFSSHERGQVIPLSGKHNGNASTTIEGKRGYTTYHIIVP